MAMRRLLCTLLLVSGCADNDQTMADCQTNEVLIKDVCTQLGPSDECVESADTCIALCDGLTACDQPGTLRPLTGWPTAPDGYCVECAMTIR